MAAHQEDILLGAPDFWGVPGGMTFGRRAARVRRKPLGAPVHCPDRIAALQTHRCRR
jgi:hypothetical protein